MPPERTAVPFLDLLRDSGLLSDAQLAELARCPEARDPTPNPLARVILQRGWLTHFQLNMIATGSAKGLIVGPYIIMDRIGEGGMGMIYKARHQHMQRIVALKVIRKEKLATSDAVQRFYQEVQLAATLHHPNIVLAFDANQVGNTHYFAMEFVDGVDLSRLVKEKGRLPVALACEYIRQAALGLQHAHEKGLVHRDIKPANLLASRVPGKKEVVKLLDMGLAKLQGGGDTGLTRIGAVIGTPDYIAPEQAMNSRSADIRADLYSLGCSLYFLLTGKPPFIATELTEVLLKHQMEKPTPLARQGVDVPNKVQAILDRLMAKHPNDRYQTPAELIADLEPFCRAQAIPVANLPPRPTEPTAQWTDISTDNPPNESADGTLGLLPGSPRLRPGRRREVRDEQARRKKRLVLIGVVGVAALLLGLVLYLVFGGSKPDSVAQGGKPTDRTDTGKGQQTSDKSSIVKSETFSGHEGDVTCVAFCDGGNKIVSGGSDKTVRVWDRGSRKEVFPLKRMTGAITCLAVLPDGHTVYAGQANGAGVSFRIENPATRSTGSSDGTVTEALVAAPNGRFIGRVGRGIGPQLLVPTPATVEQHGFPENFDAHSIAIASSNKRIAVGADNGTIHLYEVDDDFRPRRLKQLPASNKGPIRGLAFVPNGTILISAGEDGSLLAWDITTGHVAQRYDLPGGRVNCLALSSNGEYLAASGKDHKIRIFPITQTAASHVLFGHAGEVRGLAFSPDGHYLVSCGDTIRLWDLHKP